MSTVFPYFFYLSFRRDKYKNRHKQKKSKQSGMYYWTKLKLVNTKQKSYQYNKAQYLKILKKCKILTQTLTLATFIPNSYTYLTHQFIEKSKTMKMLLGKYLLTLCQSLLRVLTVQYPLFLHPVRIKRNLKKVFQVLDACMTLQFPTLTKQALLFKTKVLFTCPLWLGNCNRWTLKYSHCTVYKTFFGLKYVL